MYKARSQALSSIFPLIEHHSLKDTFRYYEYACGSGKSTKGESFLQDSECDKLKGKGGEARV
jgi:hypothetical protein